MVRGEGGRGQRGRGVRRCLGEGKERGRKGEKEKRVTEDKEDENAHVPHSRDAEVRSPRKCQISQSSTISAISTNEDGGIFSWTTNDKPRASLQ